jgi:hypothetical protein
MMSARRSVLAMTAILLSALWLSGQTPTVKTKTTAPSRTPRVENDVFWLPDATLTYEPRSRSFEIKAAGTVLSRGQGWEVQQVKPYLYHVRRASWTCYFWLINTARREVYVVWDGIFGGVGKKAMAAAPRETAGAREDMAVDVAGGTGDRVPERFTVHLAVAQLYFVPSTGDVRFGASGSTLSALDDWEARRVQEGLYHLRLKTWKNYFWKVDTGRLEAWRVRGTAAVFGKPGGEEAPLSVTIVKSSIPLSLALLRTALKAEERRKLEEIARLIILHQPIEEIKTLSAEFVRDYPDVDPEAAVKEISKTIELDPTVSNEIKALENEMEEVRNKRQEFQTMFENFDQKTNQLFNILSTVLKTMKEMQAAVSRNIL